MFVRDLLWKFLFLLATVLLVFGMAAWLFQDLRELQWQGPELAPSSPILLAMALGELWKEYFSTLLWAAFGVVAGTVCLWIVLEAYFRGGAKHFWRYAGSRLGSLAVMGSATVVFGALTAQAGRAADGEIFQTVLVSAVLLAGVWFIVSIAETLARREAFDLLATDLVTVFGAMGSFLGIHFMLAAASIATVSLSATRMLHASQPSQFLAAGLLMISAVLFWSVAHSYLVVARYSTIDIMRDNAGL